MYVLNCIKKNTRLFLNLGFILIILLLPYYLFSGKLYIGGDDSRLLYVYPILYLKNVVFYSWHNFSSLSTNNAGQALVPFLTTWSLLASIIKSKMVLDYLSFSLPLILGFIFMQKLIGEIIEDSNKYKMEILLGALFYILSPIIIQNQLAIVLDSFWLLGLIPIVFFYLIKYLKTSNFLYVLFSMFLCMLFSIGLFAIPWLLGFLLPLLISVVVLSVFNRKFIKEYFRKFTIFCFSILFTQAFWLMPFMSSYFSTQKNDVGASVLSKDFLNSFSGTVISTATGNIIYPLLNLFHRQITLDFDWSLKSVFLNYYDKIIVFNLLFIVIIFLGIFFYKNFLVIKERKIFIFIFIAFLFSLFLFTVNVGPLRDIFLLLGNIPGFVMFRNFYDKFALGYVIYYSALITFCMVILKRKYLKFSKYLLLLFFLVLIINVAPIKNVIDRPFWTTKSTYTNIQLSNEYLDFLNKAKLQIQPTSNILSFPFNKASYAIVKEDNSNNAYIGTSPVGVLTGINDFSGDLSFDANNAAKINGYIANRDYKSLNNFMARFNINYVMVTKNIPVEVKKSYLFADRDLSKQDSQMINAITDKKILESEKGNYILYSAKNQLPLFISNNIIYQKVNPVMINLHVMNLKEKTPIIFRDAYNAGWKLFSGGASKCDNPKFFGSTISECANNEHQFNLNEISFLFKNSVFVNSHVSYGEYGNEWILDPIYIKNHFDSKSYTLNKDGSINLSLTLYFYPQLYFYIGVFISILTFIIAIIYYLKGKRI
jgi:hypothetical protein